MTSADIVHEFQAYSHLGEKGGGGGTLIFSNIRRPGPGLENSTRPLVFTSASGCRASKNFDIYSENQIFSYICQ